MLKELTAKDKCAPQLSQSLPQRGRGTAIAVDEEGIDRFIICLLTRSPYNVPFFNMVSQPTSPITIFFRITILWKAI